ncbi:MAG: single-stranded DNA-binding protein [Patescibacteria group bacterium]
MNLNKAFILGNITRDPEVRALPSGSQVTSFSIATNRYYTDSAGQKKEEAEFHNIVCFGKLADIASRYLNKGAMVMIEGRIKTRNWVNQSGVKQYRTEIIAESLQLGPRNSGGGGTPGAGGASGYKSSNYGKPFSSPEPENIKTDEIPIIEENYTPPNVEAGPPSTENAGEPKNSFQGDASDEIDVKDIPF